MSADSRISSLCVSHSVRACASAATDSASDASTAGGVLPTLPQRTLGVGGTAGMVHPSTGFMVSKTLLSVRSLVDTLAEELQGSGEKEVDADAVAEKAGSSSNHIRVFARLKRSSNN